MITLASYFWPTIWAMIGIAAVVTVALCLLIATLPGPRLSSRAHGVTTRSSRPYHGFRPARHVHV